MKKLLFLGAVCVISCASFSAITPQISYETWDMPNGMKPMGVMGVHARMDFNDWSYGGISLLSAVAGQDVGGFFAFTYDIGLQHDIAHHFFWDIGGRVGGGGGHATPVGDGLFYEPYAGLGYHFADWRAEIYYSYVRFVYGSINSDQVGFALTLPIHFFETKPNTTSENYIAALTKAYFPQDNAQTTDQTKITDSMQFLGIELGHFFSQQLFLFFDFSGAMHGNHNGYAEELLGAGYRFPLFGTSKLFGLMKMALGSGGGGAVDTGSGFIVHPALGLEYQFAKAWGAEIDVGYLNAPSGNFSAYDATLLLKYYFSKADSPEDQKKWRARFFNQTYFNPRNEANEINPTMQLLGAAIDYFFLPNFYVVGETAFAYIGKNTGGYFSGMVGPGIQSKNLGSTHLALFGETLIGAAGGAGLSIGDGALIEPRAGLLYYVNPSWGFQVAVGDLIAFKGDFQSVTLSSGIFGMIP